MNRAGRFPVTENGTPLAVKQVWSKKDPLHSISYDIPRGAVNNGTLTFPSTSCMHMFEVNGLFGIFHAGDLGYRPLRQRQHGVDDPAQGAHDRRDQITLKKP